jgi:hypothetical protein
LVRAEVREREEEATGETGPQRVAIVGVHVETDHIHAIEGAGELERSGQ